MWACHSAWLHQRLLMQQLHHQLPACLHWAAYTQQLQVCSQQGHQSAPTAPPCYSTAQHGSSHTRHSCTLQQHSICSSSCATHLGGTVVLRQPQLQQQHHHHHHQHQLRHDGWHAARAATTSRATPLLARSICHSHNPQTEASWDVSMQVLIRYVREGRAAACVPHAVAGQRSISHAGSPAFATAAPVAAAAGSLDDPMGSVNSSSSTAAVAGSLGEGMHGAEGLAASSLADAAQGSEGPTSQSPISEGPISEGPTSEGPISEGGTSEGPVSDDPISEEVDFWDTLDVGATLQRMQRVQGGGNDPVVAQLQQYYQQMLGHPLALKTLRQLGYLLPEPPAPDPAAAAGIAAGMPPPPVPLKGTMRPQVAGRLRKRFAALADLLGPEAAHQVITRNPKVLMYRSATLARKLQGLLHNWDPAAQHPPAPTAAGVPAAGPAPQQANSTNSSTSMSDSSVLQLNQQQQQQPQQQQERAAKLLTSNFRLLVQGHEPLQARAQQMAAVFQLPVPVVWRMLARCPQSWVLDARAYTRNFHVLIRWLLANGIPGPHTHVPRRSSARRQPLTWPNTPQPLSAAHQLWHVAIAREPGPRGLLNEPPTWLPSVSTPAERLLASLPNRVLGVMLWPGVLPEAEPPPERPKGSRRRSQKHPAGSHTGRQLTRLGITDSQLLDAAATVPPVQLSEELVAGLGVGPGVEEAQLQRVVAYARACFAATARMMALAESTLQARLELITRAAHGHAVWADELTKLTPDELCGVVARPLNKQYDSFRQLVEQGPEALASLSVPLVRCINGKLS